jgi:S1-C subfamily serine protease
MDAGHAVGDKVYAVGNPLGLEGTFSEGIISGMRFIGGHATMQITAPISPGSSGGPILDGSGSVIGVAVATFKNGQNLNLAIPVGYVSRLLTIVSTDAGINPLGHADAGRPMHSKTSH